MGGRDLLLTSQVETVTGDTQIKMQVFDFKEKEFLVLFFYFQGIRDYAVDSQ